MDYEKKYKEALERASKLKVQNPFDTVGQMVEHIFPELKESEDEKVREALIELVKCNERSGYLVLNNVSTGSMIAWLEKQGKQLNKSVFDAEDRMMLDAIAEGLHDTVVAYSWKNFGDTPIDDILAWIKKQGEQKDFTSQDERSRI